MNINRYKKLLYKSFETKLTPAERDKFTKHLKNDPGLENLWNEVTKIRQEITASGKENFPEGFEFKLIQNTEPFFRKKENYNSAADILTKSFRMVSLSAALLLILMSVYNITAGNNSLIRTFFEKSSPTMEYFFSPKSETILANSK